MLLSKAHDEYLAYRRSEGYRNNTIAADAVALRRLRRTTGNVHVATMTPAMMDGVFAEMYERQLSASTVNVTVTSLRGFFKWCRERGHIAPNSYPMSGRRYRQREAKEMTRVPLAQFPALLDAARNPRDRMLLSLGLYTMGRAREITGIQMEHVDLDSEEILVYIQKKDVYDRIPISAELRREIARWLPIYAEHVGPLKPHYYLTPAAVPCGRKHNSKMRLKPADRMKNPEDPVHYALNQMGITGSRFGLHVLRRSSARARFDEMAKLGYDGALRRVSAWLHHSSVTITEIYLGLELDRAQRDEETKGKVMFPSLVAENVTSITRGDRDEPRIVAM
jgi:integrase